MRRMFHAGIILTFSLVCSLSSLTAQEKAGKKFAYGGVATCKACHLTKKSGAQFKIWEAGPHAKAFETLKGEKAKEFGKAKGIEDPSTAAECLQCHVTGHGVSADLKGPKLKAEEGIGCESCHGPGSEYKGKEVMEGLWAGKLKAEDYGLIKPVTEKVCVTCHNEKSPSYKPFVFAEAAKKIAHPVPKAE